MVLVWEGLRKRQRILRGTVGGKILCREFEFTEVFAPLLKRTHNDRPLSHVLPSTGTGVTTPRHLGHPCHFSTPRPRRRFAREG